MNISDFGSALVQILVSVSATDISQGRSGEDFNGARGESMNFRHKRNSSDCEAVLDSV
jgi:hypothetical protein